MKAVKVPVTLKTRMGWNHDSLNAPELARIAEDLGVQVDLVERHVVGDTKIELHRAHLRR